MGKRSGNGFGSIRKKTGKNGKDYFEGRYTDPILHEQKSVSGTTYAICAKKLQEVQARIFTGQYVTPQKQTVGTYLNEWIQNRVSLEPSTHVNYERAIRLYLVPNLGKIRLQELKYLHCQEMIHRLVNDPKRKKPLSAKTIHNAAGVLSKALADAVRAELIPNNPASSLDLPRVEKAPPQVMESTEQDEFLKIIKGHPYERIFLIGLHTGMRESEILGLQWKNINMKTGEILIEKQLARKKGDDIERKLKSTKTHKVRTFTAPQFVIEILKAQSVRQKEWRLKAGQLWQNTDGLVFTREDGSPMPHNTISKSFKVVAKKIGRPELRFHDLRHTFITDEIRSGTDLKTVADMAGHSNISTTADIYAAATSEMKKSAADRRQAAFEKANA